MTDDYKPVKISNAKPVGTLSKSLFTPLNFRPSSGSMTTYLTTIGTEIFLRVISNNQISGCGPVGRALDLGSRRREFESPHSDQKSADLEQNQPIFICFESLVEEITFRSIPTSYFHGQREDHSRCPYLCLLHIIF